MKLTSALLRLLHTLLVAMLVTGLPTHSLLAATYYVDVHNGDDSRSAAEAQNAEQPWQSLTRAMSEGTLAAGDIIRLAPGQYGDEDLDGEGNYEEFPLSLIDGVAIMGSGTATSLRADDSAIFEASGDLSADTWIGDLTLYSGEPGTGLFFDMEEATQEMVVDGVYFRDTGVRIDPGSNGGGTFGVTFSNNTFEGPSDTFLISVEGSVSQAFTVSPLFSGNTADIRSSFFQLDLYSVSNSVEFSPELVDNDFSVDESTVLDVNIESGYVDFSFYPEIDHNLFQGYGRALDVSFSGTEDGGLVDFDFSYSNNQFHQFTRVANVYVTESYGLELDAVVSVSGNTFSMSGESVVELEFSGFSSANLDFDIEVADNQGQIGGDLPSLYVADVQYVDVEVDVLLRGNTLTLDGEDPLVDLDLTSLSSASSDIDVALYENELLSHYESDVVSVDYEYSYGSQSRDLSVTLADSTMTGFTSALDIGAISVSSGSMNTYIDVHGNSIGNIQYDVVSFDFANVEEVDQTLELTVASNTIANTHEGSAVDVVLSTASSGSLEVNIQVSDNQIVDVYDSAVSFEPYGMFGLSDFTTDVLVSGNSISTQDDGVYINLSSMTSVSLTSRIDIVGNEITGGSDSAIEHYLEYVGDSNVDHSMFVAGNTISNCDYGVYGYNYAISSASVESDIVIVSNTISGTGSEGIYYEDTYFGGAEVVSNLLIAGNTISNTGGDGIELQISEMSDASSYEASWVVSNNTVTSARGNGIAFQAGTLSGVSSGGLDLTFAGNTIRGSRYDGLAVEISEYSNGTYENIVLAGNTISNSSEDGLYVNVDSQSSVSVDISIVDNISSRNAENGADVRSYEYYDGEHITIRGNTLTENGSYGIYLDTVTSSSSAVGADMGGGALSSPGLNTIMGNLDYQVYLPSFENFRMANPERIVIEDGLTLAAQGNWWGTIDEADIARGIYDSEDGPGLVGVDATSPLNTAPAVSALAELTASVDDSDVGPGDIVTLTAELTGTGDIGCASSTFHADLPEGTELIEDSVSTSKGVVFYTDGVDVGLQWLASGETITVEWQIRVAEDTACGDVQVQGRLVCSQLGTVLTDDPALGGKTDPTVVGLVSNTYYTDADGDGEGDGDAPVTTCYDSAPEGTVANTDDCDDSDAAVNTGGTEVCDSVDNDCDTGVDEGLTQTYYADGDGDGAVDEGRSVSACEAPLGYIPLGDDPVYDCDDGRDDVYPDAPEICDTVDNDCDGSTDEEGATTFYADGDGDGHGDAEDSTETCGVPEGYTLSSDDCDDDDASIYPGAAELCDTADNDCDGNTDEGGDTFSYADDDGDGFGDPTDAQAGCDIPDGNVAVAGDCDDSDASINPDATESCNGEDDDCDREADEGLIAAYYLDDDGDGYGDGNEVEITCDPGRDQVENADDCDDGDSDISPAATEVCNGEDDDCDRDTDEDVETAYYADDDSDGYGDALTLTFACSAPNGYITDAADCDDADDAINPAASETCDGLDNDCDRDTDEGVETTYYDDADGDGFGDPLTGQAACGAPADTVTDGTDCDDADAAVNPDPETLEVCNDIDDDCNGLVDDSADCEAEATPGGVDAGGGGGCNTSGGANASWLSLFLLGFALRPRRRFR